MQLFQAVTGIEVGIKEDKFGEFLLYALQGMDEIGRCVVL